MNQEIARVIELTFQNLWSRNPNAPKVKFKNVPFKQPPSGEWITLTIVPSGSSMASLGTTKVERQLGIVTFQVFTPKNSGDRRSKQIVDMICDIFRNNEFIQKANGEIYNTTIGNVIVIQAELSILTTESGDIITTESGSQIGLTVESPVTLRIVFRSPYPKDVGERDDIYQTNVICPFVADMLFSIDSD